MNNRAAHLNVLHQLILTRLIRWNAFIRITRPRALPPRLILRSVSPTSIVFSKFIRKELSTASNIKDRVNRQSVIRLLTRIQDNVNPAAYPRGAFIFAGIDEYSKEILEIVEPVLTSQLFYYSCSNRFDTGVVQPYFKSQSGSIIFVNGDQCLIYEHSSEFRKKKHITANLIKRHHKGGQSSIRFARLAEESRLHYATHVIDHLNALTTTSNWIFGSDEIRKMILERDTDIHIPLKDGGFLEFTEDTIRDRRRWITYLEQDDEKDHSDLFEKIIFYLDTDPDHLDFEPSQMDQMSSYIINDSRIEDTSSRRIVLDRSSPHYARLGIFPYIGLRWFRLDESIAM